jgi:hypothetical protein
LIVQSSSVHHTHKGEVLFEMLLSVADTTYLIANLKGQVRVRVLAEQLFEITTAKNPPQIAVLRHLAVVIENLQRLIIPIVQIAMGECATLRASSLEIFDLIRQHVQNGIYYRQRSTLELRCTPHRISHRPPQNAMQFHLPRPCLAVTTSDFVGRILRENGCRNRQRALKFGDQFFGKNGFEDRQHKCRGCLSPIAVGQNQIALARNLFLNGIAQLIEGPKLGSLKSWRDTLPMIENRWREYFRVAISSIAHKCRQREDVGQQMVRECERVHRTSDDDSAGIGR